MLETGVVGKWIHDNTLTTMYVYLQATQAVASNLANLCLGRILCYHSGIVPRSLPGSDEL